MNAVYLYKQYREVFAELDPVDCQSLLLMLIDYGTGEEADYHDLPRHLRPLFLMFKVSIDRDAEAYNARCERNRINGSKGGRPRKTVTPEPEPDAEEAEVSRETSEEEVVVSEAETPKPKRVVFAPPTEAECQEYFATRGDIGGIEASKFMDFYASKGWYVGKVKMKDWRAAVRNWMRKNEHISQNGTVARDTRAEAQRAIYDIYHGG